MLCEEGDFFETGSRKVGDVWKKWRSHQSGGRHVYMPSKVKFRPMTEKLPSVGRLFGLAINLNVLLFRRHSFFGFKNLNLTNSFGILCLLTAFLCYTRLFQRSAYTGGLKGRSFEHEKIYSLSAHPISPI